MASWRTEEAALRTGTLALADRTVDLATGHVSTGGQLRPLELRVLQVLAAHADRVVDQSTLVTEALGYLPSTRTHTLYTTIYRLRATIEPDPTTPQHVVAHRHAGYRLERFTVAPCAEEAPSNLAPEADRFVGRRAELDRLASLQVPLVTLIGPGGAGKTRLAIHHTRERPAPGGTWYVPLADCAPGGVLRATSEAMVCQEAPSVEALVRRIRGLGACRVLLDNAEHVADEVRALVERLRIDACEARWLVTSRAPLGLAGEHRIPVGPLDNADAIALLVTRALEAGAPAESDRQILAALVARLDRLPLALELAAGHLATLSASAVLAHLDRVPTSLHSTRADSADRHRSLDAVFAWTWDRLEEPDRDAARRVSVLDGPFGLAIAEAVLDDNPDTASILVRLHQLGLITASPLAGARPFAQLQTQRDAIRARTEPTQREAALALAAAFTRQRAEATIRPGALPGWFDGDQGDAGTLLALDGPDPWLAVARCEVLRRQGARCERIATAEAAARNAAPAWSARLRLEVAGALADSGRGEDADGVWADVADDADAHPLLQGYATLKRARRALASGTFDAVETLAHELELRIAECRPEERDWLPGSLLHLRATAEMMRGRPLAAAEGFGSADRAFATAGSRTRSALAKVSGGVALLQAARRAEGVDCLRDGVRHLAAQTDDEARTQVGVARMLLGQALLRTDPDTAAAELERARVRCRQTGLVAWELAARAALALLEVWRGNTTEALATLRELRALVDGEVRIGPVVLLRFAEMVALGAAGRLTEALTVADAADAHTSQFGLPVDRLMMTPVHAQLLIGARRIDEARERVERVLAELPAEIPPTPDLVLLVAELRRRHRDRRSALDAVRALCGTDLEPADRVLAEAFRASLTSELGGTPDRRVFDSCAVPDVDGSVGSWLRVHQARIGGPTGDAPTVPAYAFVLRDAVHEQWGLA